MLAAAVTSLGNAVSDLFGKSCSNGSKSAKKKKKKEKVKSGPKQWETNPLSVKKKKEKVKNSPRKWGANPLSVLKRWRDKRMKTRLASETEEGVVGTTTAQQEVDSSQHIMEESTDDSDSDLRLSFHPIDCDDDESLLEPLEDSGEIGHGDELILEDTAVCKPKHRTCLSIEGQPGIEKIACITETKLSCRNDQGRTETPVVVVNETGLMEKCKKDEIAEETITAGGNNDLQQNFGNECFVSKDTVQTLMTTNGLFLQRNYGKCGYEKKWQEEICWGDIEKQGEAYGPTSNTTSEFMEISLVVKLDAPNQSNANLILARYFNKETNRVEICYDYGQRQSILSMIGYFNAILKRIKAEALACSPWKVERNGQLMLQGEQGLVIMLTPVSSLEPCGEELDVVEQGLGEHIHYLDEKRTQNKTVSHGRRVDHLIQGKQRLGWLAEMSSEYPPTHCLLGMAKEAEDVNKQRYATEVTSELKREKGVGNTMSTSASARPYNKNSTSDRSIRSQTFAVFDEQELSADELSIYISAPQPLKAKTWNQDIITCPVGQPPLPPPWSSASKPDDAEPRNEPGGNRDQRARLDGERHQDGRGENLQVLGDDDQPAEDAPPLEDMAREPLYERLIGDDDQPVEEPFEDDELEEMEVVPYDSLDDLLADCDQITLCDYTNE